jgi:hypothetical protein
MIQDDIIPRAKKTYMNRENLEEAVNSHINMLRTVFKAHDGGMQWYEDQRAENEVSYEEVYHEVWRIMFTPVPPIASTIRFVMDTSGLVPNKYSAAHLRVLYTKNDRKHAVLRKWTKGGLDCASTLRPHSPIFLASDSDYVTTYGPIYGREHNGTVVVYEHHPNLPLHLDQADTVHNGTLISRPIASDYYDTFVDLYLLALSGCIFFSKGGYGMWAVYISGNFNCGYRLKGWNKLTNACNFSGSLVSADEEARKTRINNQPMFLEPIIES